MFSWNISLKQNHSASWYVWALIFATSLALWWAFTGIYALSVSVIILVGVYLLIENNAPASIEASVNEDGIGVDKDFFPYGEIESFSLIFDKKIPKILSIQMKKKRSNIIQIPLSNEVNASELRSFLGQYIEENWDGKMSLSDQLADRLGL